MSLSWSCKLESYQQALFRDQILWWMITAIKVSWEADIGESPLWSIVIRFYLIKIMCWDKGELFSTFFLILLRKEKSPSLGEGVGLIKTTS